MKTLFCPSCQSGNTDELDGTDYQACLECGRIDFSRRFNTSQDGEIPARYHQILNIHYLLTDKVIYGKGQYDQ